MSDVSVVIAAYNATRTIERAVASALSQQDVSVELIVVDDNSTDDTWSLLSSLADPRIRPIRMPSNGGPGAARNVGFAAATCPWIAVLDGDDEMEVDRLRRMLRRAKQDGADIVVDNLVMVRESDGAEHLMFPPEQLARMPTMTLAAFINGNNRFSAGERAYGYMKPMFSTGFLRQHGLRYPDLRVGEDYLLLAEALACGAMCAVEATAGYRYLIRRDSVSHRHELSDIERLIASDRAFARRHPFPADARRAQIRRERCLEEVYHFHQLVTALKTRHLRNTLRAIAGCPPAARHLWRPLWLRLRRARIRTRPSARRLAKAE